MNLKSLSLSLNHMIYLSRNGGSNMEWKVDHGQVEEKDQREESQFQSGETERKR